MPRWLLLLKEDHRFLHVGVDFRRFLVQFPTQSRIKSEFRPDCSGLFPGLLTTKDGDFSTSQWSLLLTVLTYLFPLHTELYFFQLQFQSNKSLVSHYCTPVKRPASSPQWPLWRCWGLLSVSSKVTSAPWWTTSAPTGSSRRASAPTSR